MDRKILPSENLPDRHWGSPSLLNGDRAFYSWRVYKIDKQQSSSSLACFEINLTIPPLSIRFIAGTLTYSIVTDTGSRVRGSNTARGKRIFSSPNRPHRPWGPPSLLFHGHGGTFMGIKRPKRDVDHSPPSSSEVKNEWS